jgi:hypothetical protein
MINLDILYHLTSALGSILSIFTTSAQTRLGLIYGLVFSSIGLFFSCSLIKIQDYHLYLITFFLVSLSNGHLQNISSTLIVKKYSTNLRAAVYVLAYFFSQFGKFLFASIIYKFSQILTNLNLSYTVYPIIIMIILQLLFIYLLTKKMQEKLNTKNNFTQNLQRISIKHDYYKFINDKTFFNSIKNLILLNGSHFLNMTILNLSLGIQFFSMINVFPLLKKVTTEVLVEEIFYSKAVHTLFLLFLPIVFLFKFITRKILLTFTFWASLIFNILILFDILNSGFLIHLFRFIWNICFITINLYSAESVPKRLIGFNTSIMYFIFKLSCIIEMVSIESLIGISIYLPIFVNILIIFVDIFLVSRLKVETHMKSLNEIDNEIG